tara:strand:- start:3238 stop:3618 length:381 start_codon:yes stop_codon:yes gene_type:complete
MSDFNHFFEALQQSILEDEFVKLTLSKPLRKSEGLVNVYVRLFVINGQETFEFKYRHETEHQYKQFSFPEAIAELELLMLQSFRTGTLFTLSEDLLVLVSKKKSVSYRDTAPSFRNKLPDIAPQSI